MLIDVAKILIPTTLSFMIGIFFTPLLTHYLYKHKMWKKQVRSKTTDGRDTPVFKSLHEHKEVGTPKMGGIVIWASALFVTLIFWLFANWLDSDIAEKMNFFSRTQTWLPIFTLIVGSLIGLLDDLMEVSGRGDYFAGGLSLTKRLVIVALTGCIGGIWFYFKLDVTSIAIPFLGELELGILIIPIFVAVMLAIYSGGVIDGIDGLAGGVFAIIFSAYAGIAFFQSQIDLATLSAVIAGGILAFLWFNIPPARFYMSETGTMGLTMTITVIAFLTKAVFVLPIIAFPLIATALSDIIQLGSKRLRNGKKVFKIAPVHHHFEAMGWPGYKVTMRYWILGLIFAILGLIISVTGNAGVIF